MKQLYLDLDGVVADIIKALVELFPGIDTSNKNNITPEMWKFIYDTRPDFFSDLTPCPDSGELLSGIHILGFSKYIILSALPNPRHGYTTRSLIQKRAWVKRNLGDRPAIFCLRSHKQDYATPDSILIDDSPENIEQWIKKKGIGILHIGASSTLAQLREHVPQIA